ncbi:polyprotein [Phytophthora megakarya]|uniref:Polyprotein n=1 Tax=Phytophthora megakarya TaxID=4795 RepID=A0A225X0J6_9STRA|nr:polyprotein [Phytophthora megakarya]
MSLPCDDIAVEHEVHPRIAGVVERGLSHLEGGNHSVASSLSSHSKLRKKFKCRRLKPRRFTSSESSATESVCVTEHVKGALQRQRVIEIGNPRSDAPSLIRLSGLSWKQFLRELKAGEIEQVCLITDADAALHNVNAVTSDEASSHSKNAEPKSAREELYDLAREYPDVFTDKIHAELSADRGVRHEIDLTSGTQYCVTRQWPLPRDQVETIDKLSESRRKAGHVRESTSPHSSPTFCVVKATGGWRIAHAFNKLNDATIPAQTPIPHKDMVLDSMAGSMIYSAIDLTDGFYQILMTEKDTPLTAVSTPSGMLGELLVMPQGLKNAPATFNRMVSHGLRPLRDFAPSYFDDILVHSRAEGDLSPSTALEQVMRENKLYANLKKCAFCALEISVLGCYVSKNGVHADPEKIASICSWPTLTNPTELRQWLGMANYLHKYTKDYAKLIQALSSLLKKDRAWVREPDHRSAFDSVKKTLISAPVLMLAYESKLFHDVCDANGFAIECALMQFDDEGRERVISYQSSQLKPAERNYPVHEKELLARRYALIKFRGYLLEEQTFADYTDHASLQTAMKFPHVSQRMARWSSFFSE